MPLIALLVASAAACSDDPSSGLDAFATTAGGTCNPNAWVHMADNPWACEGHLGESCGWTTTNLGQGYHCQAASWGVACQPGGTTCPEGTGGGTPGGTGGGSSTCQNGWELAWADEFDGPTIDTSRWEHEVNAWGGGNNELQYYTARPQNSRIENGALVIEARREQYTGPEGTRQYTSARLRTRNKGDFLYGRFEARIRLPIGRGMWPAFWMLPTDSSYGGWASSGEIDIMEIVGHEPSRTHGTLHYGGPWPHNTYSGAHRDLASGTFADAFHTFAVEWEEGEIRWYLDGVHFQTQRQWHSTAQNAGFTAPFDRRFHMLLNVAVGGDWPGSPDQNTVFPQRMEVDYVRVYRRCR